MHSVHLEDSAQSDTPMFRYILSSSPLPEKLPESLREDVSFAANTTNATTPHPFSPVTQQDDRMISFGSHDVL